MQTKPCERFRQGQSACPFPCAITLACLSSCLCGVYSWCSARVVCLSGRTSVAGHASAHLSIQRRPSNLSTVAPVLPPVKPQLVVVAVRLDIHYLVGRQPEQVLHSVLYDYRLWHQYGFIPTKINIISDNSWMCLIICVQKTIRCAAYNSHTDHCSYQKYSCHGHLA